VTTLNPGRVKPGSFSLASVVADGGLSLQGLTLSSARSAIVNYALSTSGNTLNLTSKADFAPAGLSKYAQSVGTLFGRVQGEAMSQFSQGITEILVRIPDLATLDGAYRTLGGSSVSTVPKVTMDAGMTAIQTVTNRLDGWRMGDLNSQLGGQNAALTADSREKPATAHVWIAPNASYNGGSGLSSHMFGSTVGVDGEAATMPVLLGGAFTFSQAYFSLSDPQASGSGPQYGGSLYGVGRIGNAYASAIAYGGTGSLNYGRSLNALGLGLSSSEKFRTWTAGGRLETGYTLPIGTTGMHATPFFAVEPMQVHLGAASESFGALGAGLRYHATDVVAVPISLGVQLDATWTAPSGLTLAPFMRLAWMHDFMPDRNVPRSFAELPGLTLDGTTLPTVSDAAVIHVGTQYSLGKNLSLQASLDSQMSSAYKSIGGTLNFRYSW
jgi:outer membrane autotransporter protein